MPLFIYGLITIIIPVVLAIYQAYTNGLIELANQIPVPAFLGNIRGDLLPNNVVYMLGLFQVNYGISVIVTALLLRLVLRRFLG